MLSWLHRKLYKYAVSADFHAISGIDIVRLSEEFVGPTTTKILIEQAYKEHPRNPGLGAIYIARFLETEGYDVEGVLDAANRVNKRMRLAQNRNETPAALDLKAKAHYVERLHSINHNDYSKDSVDKNKQLSIDASLNTSFEKASNFFPDLQTKLIELAPFGKEIQIRFMRDILENKQFENPELIANLIIDDYAATRFGSDKILQKFGCSLIEKKNFRLADELESYIKVVGDAVSSDAIIFHINHKVRHEAYSKKVQTFYHVKNNQKSYFVAILDDGSCIAEIEGDYRKVKDILHFRSHVNDYGATYSQIYSNDQILEFIEKAPSYLFE